MPKDQDEDEENEAHRSIRQREEQRADNAREVYDESAGDWNNQSQDDPMGTPPGNELSHLDTKSEAADTDGGAGGEN